MASLDEGARRRRSILFTRLPRAGHTKTRLIPVLGAEGAAELHRRLVVRLLREMQAAGAGPAATSRAGAGPAATARAGAGPAATARAGAGPGAELELRFTDGTERELRDWLEAAPGVDVDALRFAPQGEGDLGQRMHRAFVEATEEGVERALLFGADIPGLTPAILDRAYAALDHHDVVFGPAEDGGYYLVGLRQPQPALFEGMRWSHARVLDHSCARAAAEGLSVALIEPLGDLDEPADLERLRAYPELADLAETQRGE